MSEQLIKDYLLHGEGQMPQIVLARIEQLEQENDALRADIGNPQGGKPIEIEAIKPADIGITITGNEPLALDESEHSTSEWKQKILDRFCEVK